MIIYNVEVFKHEISFSYRILAYANSYVLFDSYQNDDPFFKGFGTHF